MAAKKRGLGRGLDALLAGVQPPKQGAGQEHVHEGDELRTLPVDLIQRGKYQPRNDMHTEKLQDLADSIKAQGVVQPIVVRKLATPGRYEIIAGERRWRASQLAGLQEVPAIIKNVPDEAALAMALIENIQRENLNALEEATALQRLADEFSLTHQEVAQAVGRSRAAVSNLIRLLDLNEDVKTMLGKSELEMGHARALLALQGAKQSEAARKVVAKGLNVREAERLVKGMLQSDDNATSALRKKNLDPDLRNFQNELSEKLGASVTIQHGSKGQGKLIVSYNSLDELEGILSHIN
jgi:ParB family chromosome partitioning protein